MAQALVRFLENEYIEVDGVQNRFVRGVFIIPGHGNVVGLGQALSQEAKHLEVWHGQNEQGMAQAAVAFAKQMCPAYRRGCWYLSNVFLKRQENRLWKKYGPTWKFSSTVEWLSLLIVSNTSR